MKIKYTITKYVLKPNVAILSKTPEQFIDIMNTMRDAGVLKLGSFIDPETVLKNNPHIVDTIKKAGVWHWYDELRHHRLETNELTRCDKSINYVPFIIPPKDEDTL